MSKSLGNAIGLTEPPLEMYGKVMSISDPMMWRYYELLTDVSTAEIGKMTAEAAAGRANPMQHKKELARRIVADAHGEDVASKASDDWAKQFQMHEAPEEIEQVGLKYSSVAKQTSSPDEPVRSELGWPVKLDKLLAVAGFVNSASEGLRKIKERAVRVNDQIVTDPVLFLKELDSPITIRLGRKVKKVVVSS